MNKPKIDFKPKTHPLLASLPKYVKDPANFEKINKAIIETVQTTCAHADLDAYAKCAKCTEKMLARRALLKKYGFKNPAQYMAWRKTHEQIKRTFPLVDWSKENIKFHE